MRAVEEHDAQVAGEVSEQTPGPRGLWVMGWLAGSGLGIISGAQAKASWCQLGLRPEKYKKHLKVTGPR